MHELEVDFNNHKTQFTIISGNISLKNNENNVNIPILSIASVFVRDQQEQNTIQYLLKIQTETNTYIIAFKNQNLRDFYKGYISYIIKDKVINNMETTDLIKTYKITNSENNKQNTKIIKNLRLGRESISSIESSKSSFMQFLVARPILLIIFNELNCTLTQFYNYIKQSYFYNSKNEKNVIDRMLNESIRKYEVTEYGYGARINTHSFLEINSEDVIKESHKTFQDSKFDFVPIYPKVINHELKKMSNFRFTDKLDLKFDCKPVIENAVSLPVYDKEILKELLDLCKLAYKSRNENQNIKNKILDQLNKYEDLLKNEEYQSFDPRRYLNLSK